jgi:hypothetical protein
MHEQEASRREFDEQVLRPPRNRVDGLSLEAGGEVGGKRIAQVGTTSEDALEARPLHYAAQLLAGELDLGELRQLCEP